MEIGTYCCKEMKRLRGTGVVSFSQQVGWLIWVNNEKFYLKWCPFCRRKLNE